MIAGSHESGILALPAVVSSGPIPCPTGTSSQHASEERRLVEGAPSVVVELDVFAEFALCARTAVNTTSVKVWMRIVGDVVASLERGREQCQQVRVDLRFLEKISGQNVRGGPVTYYIIICDNMIMENIKPNILTTIALSSVILLQ